ncbi:MAG TPA: polysaccharide biosynthesis/export family protein, partial [Croceibacterium sp.]|nr:polysaccharide biosynthesis/export family protein [Croceibacterium sp.]
MLHARFARLLAGPALAALALSGCAGGGGQQLPPASFVAMQEGPGEDYVIGPLDELTIYVWRNPELGASVQVRPDGR